MNEAVFAAIAQPLATRVKAAAAICVAGEIFDQAMKRPASPAKLLRTKMAGDAMNKTAPSGAIAVKYRSKPDDQSDLQFLLQNLEDVGVPESEFWPPRQVSPIHWEEYTRAMRGLETFLQKGGKGASFSKVERADVTGMLSFLAPQLKHVQDQAVVALLTA